MGSSCVSASKTFWSANRTFTHRSRAAARGLASGAQTEERVTLLLHSLRRR